MADASTQPQNDSERDHIIMFQPFAGSVQVAFWQQLGKLKVDVLGLDERPLDVVGTYGIAAPSQTGASAREALPPALNLGPESFTLGSSDEPPPPPQPAADRALLRECAAPGTLKNFNTIEDFKTFDRNAWLQRLGNELWEDMWSGAAVREPARLCRFSVLCFADLKKNKYIYWFAFPALASSPPYHLRRPVSPLLSSDGGGLSEPECRQLQQGLTELRRRCAEQHGPPHCPPFALLVRSPPSLRVAPLAELDSLIEHSSSSGPSLPDGVLVLCVDPSTVAHVPGWPLRNLLYLLANTYRLTQASIVCYRGKLTRIDPSTSTSAASLEEELGGSFVLHARLTPATPAPSPSPPFQPTVLGWEKNAQGKNGPRQLDLGRLMDPIRLAEQSVDLNLKLMRWRLLPALQADRLAQTKCLLIGAGTLGCGVARCLLGWGVRTITLLDNGRVAMSNPVRQSLFTFQDCEGGGRLKAEAAAEALTRIFPGVVSSGVVMSVPMPGHPLTSEDEVQQAQRDVARLEELVVGHDVVFLLTDTRESRWLPTLMAQAHDKMLINAALGFDSFLVMRHGQGRGDDQPEGTGDKQSTGCYFCTDVVGPGDSTRDRTLDQQCTVTRPGLAQVASALAVELMVALLHHPRRHHAPADNNEDSSGMVVERLDDPDRPLGILPQQIRGYLSHFTNISLVSRPFRCCTGCSGAVVDAYKASGFDMVRQACNSSQYLEDLTGLSKLRREADDVEVDWEDDDDEDEEEM